MPSLAAAPVATPPKAPARPAQERRVVTYFHEAAGESFQGTISDLDDRVRSSWTVVTKGGRRQVEQPITPERFKAILAGFDLPELQPFEVKRRDQRLDLRTNQVVSLNAVDPTKAMRSLRTFLVPAKPASPKVKAWLQLLQVPRG